MDDGPSTPPLQDHYYVRPEKVVNAVHHDIQAGTMVFEQPVLTPSNFSRSLVRDTDAAGMMEVPILGTGLTIIFCCR
jgi:hypothetical protein